MKTFPLLLTVLTSSLLLCGCLFRHAAPTGPAIDLVQSGTDTSWQGGAVLHVTKRDGNSLQGIQITSTSPDGEKSIVTADTGTIASGATGDTEDKHSVILTLSHAHMDTQSNSGKKSSDFDDMTLVLTMPF